MAGTATDVLGGSSSPGAAVDVNDGLSSSTAIKGPCRVATTANVTLRGEQTIDGVLTAESRVLVWHNTDARENGIYETSTGDWRRTADFNRNSDVRKGTAVYVTSGAVGSGLYFVTVADPISIGTTSITFQNYNVLVSGALLAGNNLSDVGSRIAAHDNLVRYDSTQVITPVADTLNLDSATAPLIDIPDGAVTAITLGNGKLRTARFTGSTNIIVGPNIIANNGGVDIWTNEGDIALFRGEPGGVVRVTWYPAAGPGGRPLAFIGFLELYVATTGDDSNKGTQAAPFLTIQAAINAACTYDLQGGGGCIIYVADGAYSGTPVISDMPVGCTFFYIIGNATTPGNCTVDGFLVSGRARVTIGGFEVEEMSAAEYGYLEMNSAIGDMNFVGDFIDIGASDQASIDVIGITERISGNKSASHLFASGQSKIQYYPDHTVLVGVPDFTLGYAAAGTGAYIDAAFWPRDVTGTCAGPEYLSEVNAVIETGGVGFPNSTAGLAHLGGYFA